VFRALLVGAAFLLGLAVFQVDLRGQSDLIPNHSKLKGVVLPVYLDFGSKPAALLRAKAIYPDHQRRAFFRIGVLPMLVAEDVTVEVCDPERAAAALAGLRDGLKPHAHGAAIELRRVAFQFPAEPAPRLKAATLRLQDNGQWQLLDFTLQSPTNAPRIPRGRLQITGDHAGRVTWETAGGPAAFNLFTTQATTNTIASIQRLP
jgi:hypothetical protein